MSCMNFSPIQRYERLEVEWSDVAFLISVQAQLI